MYPFERFSNGAKRALALAQEQAQLGGKAYIGSEHLLLGLLLADRSTAQAVLLRCGVDASRARSALEQATAGAAAAMAEQAGPTARVKRVIELAFEAARREKSSTVGTEHLLLAVVEEGRGPAARVLAELGASPDRLAEARRLVAEAWPPSGERVLLHDQLPPYRLWEGRVIAHEEGTVTVAVPDHPAGSVLHRRPTELHSVPSTAAGCEQCLYRPA